MDTSAAPSSAADMPLVEHLPGCGQWLRLAVVTETYPPEVNGVALSAARFVRALCDRHHDVQLIRPRQQPGDAPACGSRYEEVLQRGVSIPKYPDLRMGLPARRALIRQWSLRRPDLVHIVTEGPLGWSALQAARKLRIPVCSDFRTNFHAYSRHYGIGWLKRPIVAYLRKFHNLTDLTLVPTEAMRVHLAELGIRQVAVVSRGVDTRQFSPAHRSAALRRQWGVDDATPVALYVGRLAAEKNLRLLPMIARMTASNRPSPRWVIVGDGPDAATLKAQMPQAIFTGTLTGQALSEHFASADVFVFPSLTETFGNVVVEAMASGLAVAAFDDAAAREHLRGCTASVLAAPGDDAGFVASVADLLSQPQRIAQARAFALATAQPLDWDRVVDRLEAQLRAVAASTQHASPRYVGALSARMPSMP